MLLASIVLTSVCLVFFKIISLGSQGEIKRIAIDPRFYLAIAIYLVAFVMWIIAASKIDYVVLAFTNALGLVLGGVIGYYFFNESFGALRAIAFLLIMAGVFILFFY
jgi:drug/metabolite transporter (DMT)-like permease